jgi:RimJ/RimL family protein N-acetyltransferase
MRNAMMIGERVYLRPLEKTDAEVIARHAHEETETFFESGRIPLSPIAVEKWIEGLYKQQPSLHFQFAVCLLETDEMIGSVGLGGIDWINRTAETESYLDSAAHRGKGYGPEAKHLLLEYAFEHLHIEMLSSFVWEPNARSASAVLSQGYRPAGRIKSRMMQNGEFRDMLAFDISRDEWLEARARWQAARQTKK